MVKNQRPIFNTNDPFVAVSSNNTLIFKTGNQRSEKPLYANKIAPCRLACPICIADLLQLQK